MIKRLFDLLLSSISLVALSPLLLILGLLVKLDSRGPVFYRGQRVGQGGKCFGMYKFRTMVVNADRTGPAVTRGQDARVTRVGRLLRHWKLDEIPQLFNVLRGEMSLVGPRPEAPCYVEHYTPEQRRVLQVRPGITGLTQIRFRHEETLLSSCSDLEEEYICVIMPSKLAIDLEYIANCSLLGDIKLMLHTFLALFERDRPVQPRLAETVQRPDSMSGAPRA